MAASEYRESRNNPDYELGDGSRGLYEGARRRSRRGGRRGDREERRWDRDEREDRWDRDEDRRGDRFDAPASLPMLTLSQT